MLKGGYTGRVLVVNLNKGACRVEDLPETLAAAYIGGAGLGVKLLYDLVKPGVDPLGPENVLIFSTGPLTGTPAPCAGRMAVVTRSPLTGAVGMALSGGHFGAELKFAGYDALIIEGRSETPVYLYIKGEQVQFKSAERLWGMLTTDTQLFIKEEAGDHNTRVACIGPAGERLSRIACIINERRAAGRKGVGAVMGSKNLKAVAVRGDKGLPLADRAAFMEAVRKMNRHLRESPVLYPSFAKVGTSLAADATGALGILAAKNWQATGVFNPIDRVGSQAHDRYTIRRQHCYNCPVGCSQTRLVREGEYAGLLSEGPEFETIYSFGTNLGIDYIPAIIAADRLADEYGLDSISAGVTVGLAMELYERGIIDRNETGGLELYFGNHRALMELLRQMAYREGFGALLADGTRRATQTIGRGAEAFALHIKGLELPAYDVRGAKAHGLSYCTSYTGADHNRGYAFQEIFGVPVPQAVDRLVYEGKGELCKWNQDVRAATCDCPPTCAFLLDTALAEVALENTAELLNAASGLNLTPEQVQRVGERLNNLARVYNLREGFTREDDLPPRRLMEEAIPGGTSAGEKLAREDVERMLDEYYRARGWDARGVPTRGKLLELGLAEAVEDLRAIGLISG